MLKSSRRSRNSATEVLIVTALLCLSAPVWAQTEAPAAPLGSQPYTLHGVDGLWFPMTSARKLLTDVLKGSEMEQTLKLIEQRLQFEKDRSELLNRNVKTIEQIAVQWKGTAEAQAKQLATAIPWWRHPYLWTAVGFVVGTGVTVGLTFAAQRATN